MSSDLSRYPRLRLLPLILFGSGLLAASVWLPGGVLVRPWTFFALLALGVVAGLHRPLGESSLGLGTLVLPAAAARLGVAPAAFLAFVAQLVARLFVRQNRRGDVAHPAGLVGLFEEAAVVGLATLAAAYVQPRTPAASPGLGSFGPLLVYGVVFVVLRLAFDALEPAFSRAPRELARRLLPVTLDLFGWWAGALLVDLALELGWGRAWPLFLAFTLLAVEAARVGFLRGVSDERASDLERLQHAHQRILGETSGNAGIATQILIECANVVPFHIFQLELFEGDERSSFTAGPDRELVEGVPVPPSVPPMLPGIHRRADWLVMEHELRSKGKSVGVLGVLRLWCDPRRLEPGSEAHLASLVPLMASSLDRARLDREAKIDPLTELPVRRVLEIRLQELYREAAAGGKPLAVILCDIDHFKRINDTWGHDAGDDALRLVARALASQQREGDLCCRYGGEEFTVLLAATGGGAALRLAERLRAAVAAIEFHYRDEAVPLTVSAGVASFPELYVRTGSELLLLADEALYAAKEAGRDLALLHLGHGRFLDPGGRPYTRPGAVVESTPPRIFR